MMYLTGHPILFYFVFLIGGGISFYEQNLFKNKLNRFGYKLLPKWESNSNHTSNVNKILQDERVDGEVKEKLIMISRIQKLVAILLYMGIIDFIFFFFLIV